MSGPSLPEQTPLPEQLAVAHLTDSAQDALNFRNAVARPLENGGSIRECWDGREQIICHLSETTPTDGPITYMFRFPCVIKVNGEPKVVGLDAEWAEGDAEVSQSIIAADDEETRVAADFEGPSVEHTAKILNLHLGDPTNDPRQGRLQKLRRKLGRLIAH